MNNLNVVPTGGFDGGHWTLKPNLHFTEPGLKPLQRGYTWYGGLEEKVLGSMVGQNSALYPKGLERIANLDRRSI